MTRPPLVPELYVTDIRKSVAFYCDILGFKLEYERPESGFAAVSFKGSRLMLEQTPSLLPASDEALEKGQGRTAELVFPFGRGINFEFAIADLEAVHTRIKHYNYPIRLDVHEKWYRVGDTKAGVRQFLVQDPDGYLLRFQQAIGTRPA